MLFVCCDLWEIFIILQLSSLSMCKDTVALGPLPAMVMQDFFIFWQVFRTVKFLKVWHHYFEGTMLGWWCSYLWILFVYIVTSLKSKCFWIQGSKFVSKAIDIMAKELIAVATPGEGCCRTFMLPSIVFSSSHVILNPASDMLFPSLVSVDQVQLDRAKQSTKSDILINLESRVCYLFSICIFYFFYNPYAYLWSVFCRYVHQKT